MRLILKSIKQELKGETELLPDSRAVAIGESSGTTFQLVARSAQYEIRFLMTNSTVITSPIPDYCTSLRGKNMIDCICSGGDGWRPEYDELKCWDFWIPIAKVSDDKIIQNIGGILIYLYVRNHCQ